MSFKHKYNKYKTKYLNLKKHMDGGFKWRDDDLSKLEINNDVEKTLFRLNCFADISYKNLDQVQKGLYFLLKKYILNYLLPKLIDKENRSKPQILLQSNNFIVIGFSCPSNSNCDINIKYNSGISSIFFNPIFIDSDQNKIIKIYKIHPNYEYSVNLKINEQTIEEVFKTTEYNSNLNLFEDISKIFLEKKLNLITDDFLKKMTDSFSLNPNKKLNDLLNPMDDFGNRIFVSNDIFNEIGIDNDKIFIFRRIFLDSLLYNITNKEFIKNYEITNTVKDFIINSNDDTIWIYSFTYSPLVNNKFRNGTFGNNIDDLVKLGDDNIKNENKKYWLYFDKASENIILSFQGSTFENYANDWSNYNFNASGESIIFNDIGKFRTYPGHTFLAEKLCFGGLDKENNKRLGGILYGERQIKRIPIVHRDQFDSEFIKNHEPFINPKDTDTFPLFEFCNNYKYNKIIITGHSLGSAVANLTYLFMFSHPKYRELILKNKVKVVGFATPKTIRKIDYDNLVDNLVNKFNYNIHSNCLQIINKKDPVTKIPPNQWISQYKKEVENVSTSDGVGIGLGAALSLGVGATANATVTLATANPFLGNLAQTCVVGIGAATGKYIGGKCSYYIETNNNQFSSLSIDELKNKDIEYKEENKFYIHLGKLIILDDSEFEYYEHEEEIKAWELDNSFKIGEFSKTTSALLSANYHRLSFYFNLLKKNKEKIFDNKNLVENISKILD
jgi:hypothetical protein